MNSEFPHYRNGYDPAFCEVDRIINERRDARGRVSYLVKWCELGYAESTWEFEEDLTNDEGTLDVPMYQSSHALPVPCLFSALHSF